MANEQNCTHSALIGKAAELRVAGYDWAYIGEQVNRQPDTVRRWQYDFSETWNEKLKKALDAAIPRFENEALQTLRHCADHLEGGNQVQAAKALAKHARQLRGTKQKIEHTGESEVTFKVVYPDGEDATSPDAEAD